MKTIHVLHVVGKMHRGGIETLLMCIYRRIDRSKVQFDFLVSTKDPGYYDEEIRKLGGQLLYAPSRRSHPYTYKKELYNLLKAHSEIKIIQLHLSSCSYIEPLILAKKAGIKFRIAHSHNTQCTGKIRNLIHNINRKRLSKYATTYFACSEEAGVWMFSPESWKRGRLIKNGIESEKYVYSDNRRKQMRNKLHISDNEFVIGYVGRFEEQKNPMFICEIFEALQKKSDDTKLLLVGDGSIHLQMEKFFQEKNINDKVIFTGVVENVNDYLQAMDCFILPSRFEGLGIVAIESQAAGVPTLLSEQVPKEAAVTELASFLPIDKGEEVWVNHISEIIEKRYIRKNMQQEIIDTGYDINSTAKELEKIYLTMCEE